MAEFWRESASANEISITHRFNILRFIFSDLFELDSGVSIKPFITWTFEIFINLKFAL